MYTTTRNNKTYSVEQVLSKAFSPDGGLFVPCELPHYDQDDLFELTQKTFSQCVAEVLNQFYGTNLSGWDIEFSVGRHPIKVVPSGQKIYLAECWRNPGWKFSRFVNNISEKIRPGHVPGFWDETVIRIAVLFGITAGLMANGEIRACHPMDAAVSTGNFSAPLSLWYARKMGLPIQNIICSCNENGSVWELIHQKQLHTDAIAKQTLTPDGDFSIPAGLEQFIYECGGREEVNKFLSCWRKGQIYEPDEAVWEKLSYGMYSAVIGDDRTLHTISGFFSGYSYLFSPYTALIYAGVQDYRVNNTENRSCLIISEKSPECELKTISDALQISLDEAKNMLKNI